MSTVEEARIRQARVHHLIQGGESVAVDASFVPDAAAAAAATAAASSGFQVAAVAGGGSGSGSGGGGGSGSGTAAANSRDASRVSAAAHSSKSKSKSGGSSNSPSTSRNRPPGGGGQQPSPLGPGVRGDLPRDTLGIGLKFQKENVVEAGGRSVQPSSLAQQLRLARSGLDNSLDSGFPRSATGTYVKLTVYLPHEEGSMVQIAVLANCTAHELVKEALRTAREENGGEIPVGLIPDAWAYRVFVAEEDGEVDSDFPVLDVRVNVTTLGVESFVLRDRVDAALPSGAGGGRPASTSVVQEGPGEDHSTSSGRHGRGPSTSGGFKSLETEKAGMPEQADKQTVCCGGTCVVQ